MNAKTFVTERLPLAVFIHATAKLKFLRCELAGRDRVQLVFADPAENGASLELAYEKGELAPARDLFASQTFLRRKMYEVLNGEWKIEHERGR